MANTGVMPAGPSSSRRRHTSIEDLPAPILGRILQEAREDTRGQRFLTYATVSSTWRDASLESVRAVFLQGEEAVEALAGGLDTFEELKCVSVRDYAGAALPPDLGTRLKRVEVLQFKNCPNIQALPDSMREMTSLKKLNVIGLAQLAALPPSLSELSSLESLLISSCASIRDSGMLLAGLTGLKRLDLRCFIGGSLCLQPLQHLQHLDLRGVQLDHIPESLGSLPHLRFLFINCFSLPRLPPGFPALKSLKLGIAIDPMDPEAEDDGYFHPPSFDPLPPGSYPSLKHLTISGDFRVFPEMICELTALKTLVFSADNMEWLPLAFTRLVNLRTLGLVDCGQLREIPEDIATSMRNLESLTCSGRVSEVSVCPAWRMKLLDVRRLFDLLQLRCPGGCLLVEELRVSCDLSSDRTTTVCPSEVFRDTEFRGLKVLRVTHREATLVSSHDLHGNWVTENLYDKYGHSCSLPSTMPRMTELQLLDLSEAACVVDFSNCSGLASLKEVKLSPDWPQVWPDSWQNKVGAIRSAMELLRLPNLGEASKLILKGRCRDVLQALISQQQLQGSKEAQPEALQGQPEASGPQSTAMVLPDQNELVSLQGLLRQLE